MSCTTSCPHESSSTRLAALKASFDEYELDAMFVTDETNVRYLSGFTGDSSYLLVTPDDVCLLSDGRYAIQIAQECPQLRAAIRLPDKAMLELVAEQINALGSLRIGLESAHVCMALYTALQSQCDRARWVPTEGIVQRLRVIKDAGEIALIRRAIEIAQRTYRSIVPKLRPDWTELEIAHEMESTMRVLGAEGVSFAPIVAAGASGAFPHYRPRRVPLGDTSSLLLDFGAKFQGYASDLTRTLTTAHPQALDGHRSDTAHSDSFRRAYDAVLEAQLAAIDAIAPGVATKDVDAVARQVLAKHGLADAFVHGLGHGIGLQIHEAPRLSALSEETLAPGMVITVEPGVYFEGQFGIRIEDDVLVTDGGREVLSSLDKDLNSDLNSGPNKGLDDCSLLL